MLTPQPSTCHAPTFGIKNCPDIWWKIHACSFSYSRLFRTHNFSVGTSTSPQVGVFYQLVGGSAQQCGSVKKDAGDQHSLSQQMVILDSLKYSKTWHQLILFWFFVCPNCCPFSELCDWTKLSSQQRLRVEAFQGSKKLIQHPWQKRSRRSKKKRCGICYLPWSLVKNICLKKGYQGHRTTEIRGKLLFSSDALTMKSVFIWKKASQKKTDDFQTSKKSYTAQPPVRPTAKVGRSGKIPTELISAWNHLKIETIPSFSLQNVGSVSFDNVSKTSHQLTCQSLPAYGFLSGRRCTAWVAPRKGTKSR